MNSIASPGKKIAMMTANGFNEAEFITLQRAIMTHRAQARIISSHNGIVYSDPKTGNGISYAADTLLSETLAIDYDCLIVVGGSEHIYTLAEEPHAIRLMRAFLREKMPILLVSEASKLLDAIGDKRLAPDSDSDNNFVKSDCVVWSIDGSGLSSIFNGFFEIVSARQLKQDSDNGVAA